VRRAAFCVLVVSTLAAGAAPVVCADARFRVIAHPGVKGSQIRRATLSSIFLKQAPKWGDGSVVLPVDQSVQSSVRKAFSNDILQQEIVAVQAYWNRQIAGGVWPPPVKASDKEIVSYVASTPGAIGYVSAETPIPGSVNEIAVVD
jgi:ABC-type phosphate transport system substrate-binding protein